MSFNEEHEESVLFALGACVVVCVSTAAAAAWTGLDEEGETGE